MHDLPGEACLSKPLGPLYQRLFYCPKEGHPPSGCQSLACVICWTAFCIHVASHAGENIQAGWRLLQACCARQVAGCYATKQEQTYQQCHSDVTRSERTHYQQHSTQHYDMKNGLQQLKPQDTSYLILVNAIETDQRWLW